GLFYEGKRMSKDNGGPAFPCSASEGCGSSIDGSGMTLRDYFAAKAMQAFITGAMSDGTPLRIEQGDDSTAAKAAYIIADAMIKERNKL
ncbi:hypothetical protein, partial [Klebsiella aerogenes]|uniref:hypothetical protein n=2 Tax=Klebsiella aerogenes TaxID=548 RepID=UPI003D33702F